MSCGAIINEDQRNKMAVPFHCDRCPQFTGRVAASRTAGVVFVTVRWELPVESFNRSDHHASDCGAAVSVSGSAVSLIAPPHRRWAARDMLLNG